MAVKKDKKYAANQNKKGLAFYESWEIDRAIEAFQEASRADYNNPEYHLNLARAYARSSSYHQAIDALGEYLRTETDDDVAERYQRLFSSALDEVETLLIDTAQKMGMSTQQIGKAIQMWLEYRITIGRRPLRIPKPELWAAALTYAITKVNFTGTKGSEIATTYKISERSLREKYKDLVSTLDLMPADYRYFVGENNPLDKLVEAAQILEDLDRQFQADD